MRTLIRALAAILAVSCLAGCKAKVPSESDMGAYLLVYFTDPSHSLHMAVSRDGYTFTAVNNAMPVISGDTIAEQRGIRDPHIFRGPDGAFYIAMTDLHIFGRERGLRSTRWERDGEQYGWGNNRALVLMKSTDLVNWTHSTVRIDREFPDEFGDLGCAWAPETTFDPSTGQLMVYFTIRREGKGRTKLYYAYADDDFTRLTSKPELLFEYPDSTIQVLDADIMPMPDGRYCMTYVAQEQPGGIKMAISDSISGGYAYQPEQIDFEPGACEAPNMWKRIGEDRWVLMYDVFSIRPHNFGFAETTDFKTFTPLGRFNEGPMKATNFRSPKHGAVIQITSAEADYLENYWKEHPSTVDVDSIILSDPCVLAYEPTQTYYMTGTGGRLWKSTDLRHWSGPMDVAHHDPASWMGPNPQIWAAELHEYNGRYYYFATFTNDDIKIDTVGTNVIPRRASHVLVADHPEGPYVPVSDADYLPADKPTLDGTFWVDADGEPYMVYCHEWLQNNDGTIERIRLKPDLSASTGEGEILFRASDSPWSRETINGRTGPNRVTDGPWLFRTDSGRLGMLWTSWIYDVYTQGVAYSESGTLAGPWTQQAEPVTPPNHGHGMLFTTFDGRRMMSVHSHRSDEGRYIRHPRFFPVDLSGDSLRVEAE